MIEPLASRVAVFEAIHGSAPDIAGKVSRSLDSASYRAVTARERTVNLGLLLIVPRDYYHGL